MSNGYFNDFNPLDGKTLEVMDSAGTVDESLRPAALDDPKILSLYQQMAELREMDDMAIRMQREGRMGTYAPVRGQEACQASAAALAQGDWLVPSYREMGAMHFRGIPFEMTYRYWMGDERGSAWEPEKRVMPISIPVGSQPLYAAGLAWAMKLQKQPSVVVAYFGDGASSEGEVHEAMNFAGVFKLPVVFFCQNNQYAISVPRRGQTAAKTIAQKANGYGFPGIQLYGNDLLAVWAAMSEALARARAGEGPSLIEALTYRFGPHTTADDPTKYRDEAEVENYKPYDPLIRLRAYLTAKGLWDDAKEAAMWAAARAEAERVALSAEAAATGADPAEIFDHTYRTPPPDLARQRKAFLADLARRKEGDHG